MSIQKTNNKILILGAGNAQIDAIQLCKEMGYLVVGCSYTTVDNGIPFLDFFEHVDIKSIDGVVETAKKHNVKAIYSIGSDVAMPTVMRASEALGLPHFISSRTAEACHSKSLMRRLLGDDFKGNVEYAECFSMEEALNHKSFPAMMKPTDSQGQRGCFKVDSPEDIRKEFETSMSFSHEGKVILEAFLPGEEISVNGYMKDGKMIFGIVSDRISFSEYPGGIIKEHVLPSKLSQEHQEKALKISAEAAERIGIDNGPCYFQIKTDADNNPKILEIAPRLDGCHMWNLIKHHCGVNLLQACFSHLLNGSPCIEPTSLYSNAEHRLVFFSQAPWTKFDINLHDVSDSEYSFYYYSDGDKVRRLNGYIEKCGYKIVKRTEGNKEHEQEIH